MAFSLNTKGAITIGSFACLVVSSSNYFLINRKIFLRRQFNLAKVVYVVNKFHDIA